MLFLTHFLHFVIQIKLQEAEKASKVSIDLTAKLNQAEIKIAEKVINKPQPKKTGSSAVRPRLKKTGTNVVSNKRKQTPRKLAEDNAPLSDYVKMCNEKKKRNTDVLERLGLIRNKKNTAALKNKKAPKRIRCTIDHRDICSYKAEDDKRYLKEGNDLYDLHCIVCNRLFVEMEVAGCIVPTVARPLYICLGRNKFQCQYSYCYECYQNVAVKENPIKERRRSNRHS